MKKYFEAALSNIARYGDTDILPNPVENRLFEEAPGKVTELLMEAYQQFENYFANNPPKNIRVLSPVNHTGFRWSTQIDPFWNAFVLGLTLSLAEKIEAARIPYSANRIFSYRVDTDKYLSGSLFRATGWKEFMSASLALAAEHPVVVICDLADCYSHVSHHRLENAFDIIDSPHVVSKAILKYLSHYTDTRSSGLPVGGPASRMLVELVLNFSDHLLNNDGIKFCRFADDYHIFCSSMDDAYAKILKLSTILDPDGLSLQKSKTRILSSPEFIAHENILKIDGGGVGVARDASLLMSLTLRFDPYSATAEEDYARLQEELDKIDIIGLLNEELAKSRVHLSITKRIVQAIKYLDVDDRFGAVVTMLGNADSLFPIFGQVCLVISSIFDDLTIEQQDEVCARIRQMIEQKSFVLSLELHMAYAVRVLGRRKSVANIAALTALFNASNSSLVSRDVIAIFSNWAYFPWLSLRRGEFDHMAAWERRAFIMASFSMGDEGAHWRRAVSKRLDPFEAIVREWFAERVVTSKVIPLYDK